MGSDLAGYDRHRAFEVPSRLRRGAPSPSAGSFRLSTAVVCLCVHCRLSTDHRTLMKTAHANFSSVTRSATAGNTMGAMGCTAPTSRVIAVHVASSQSARPPVRCCCPVAPSVGQGLPPCLPALADRVSLCSEHSRGPSRTRERCVEHSCVHLWTRERCRER